MARSEARLLTEVWEDRDFIALTDTAQRLFMFLLSQPDLAHSGVIALRERRWSRKCANQGTSDVERDLKALEAGRFLVVDWDSEEILIRSLIRRDRIFKQPNVMRAAVDNVPLIESQIILRALAVEMDRIRRENPDLTEHQRGVLGDMDKALAERVQPDPEPDTEKAARNPSANPSEKGSGNPCANPSAATPGVRGEVTNSATNSPFPGASLVPPPAGDAAAPAAPGRSLAIVRDEPATAQQIVGWWLDQCKQRPPGRVVGHMAKEIKGLLEEGIAPAFIRDGISEWLTRGAHPGTLASFVNAAMNRTPQRSTRDQRVQGWLDLEFPGQEAYA